MIRKILTNSVKALSNPELLKNQSKDELNAIYILLQVFRILVVLMWVFSIIESLFIGSLLDPTSSLFEWSMHHKYLISIFSAIFFYLPVNLIFILSIRMGNIAIIWHRDQLLQILSPLNVTVLLILLLFLTVPFSAFVVSL